MKTGCPAMQINLRSGRNISSQFSADKKNAALVNESFVKAAGLINPIGAQIRTSDYFDNEPKTIVGVIEDFHSGLSSSSNKTDGVDSM
jgi:hypothetical protein